MLREDPDGVSMTAMEQRFRVPNATLYRDLKTIEAAGIPLRRERRGKRVYWAAGERARGRDALIRQWGLVRLLLSRHNGMTVREICEELLVADSTVRDDLRTLLEAGLPLVDECEPGAGTRWSIMA